MSALLGSIVNLRLTWDPSATLALADLLGFKTLLPSELAEGLEVALREERPASTGVAAARIMLFMVDTVAVRSKLSTMALRSTAPAGAALDVCAGDFGSLPF